MELHRLRPWGALAFGTVFTVLAAGGRSETVPSSAWDASGATLDAEVELHPHLISTRARESWIIAYVELYGRDPAAVDVPTVRLADSIPADPRWVVPGDRDGDHIPDLMLRFPRAMLDPRLTVGTNHVELTGKLRSGERFRGSDDLLVIDTQNGVPGVSRPFW